MKTRIVITDLTRMQQGRVCIAGYDTSRRCVRPMLPPPGISEQSILQDGKAITFPWAVAELDLLQHTPQPPHTEDHRFDPISLRLERVVADEKRRREILGWSLFDDARDIFEQEIVRDHGFYVNDGVGPRSVGTVRPHAIKEVTYSRDADNKFGYRIVFKDSTRWFDLKITDLTFNYYCNHLRGPDRDPQQIAFEMTQLLKRRATFIRIGLPRGWKERPGLCFLQANAIHTFPDYTGGKTFVEIRD